MKWMAKMMEKYESQEDALDDETGTEYARSEIGVQIYLLCFFMILSFVN